MSDELEGLWRADDSVQREAKTMRHEAGHAAAAWIIRGDVKAPPFDYIDIGTMSDHKGGVVPGEVHYAGPWFASLSAIDRGTILLAGIYVQDGDVEHDREAWRGILEGIEGADGVDDYVGAMHVASEAGIPQPEFDEQVRLVLDKMRPSLNAYIRIIVSVLKPGQCTPAESIVAAFNAAFDGAPADASVAIDD